MGRVAAIFAVLFLVSAGAAHAMSPRETLSDPSGEARARALSSELRCLVCQNQSIDDSDAPLALDLRRLVRERIVAGDSDAAVKDFVVARYGEFVLLRPMFNARTYLLWFAPLLLLAIGLAGLVVWYRRTYAAAPAPEALSEAEARNLDALLGRPDLARPDRTPEP